MRAPRALVRFPERAPHQNKEMPLEKAELWMATKAKYENMFAYVKNMQVKDKRCLFTVLRNYDAVTVDTFLPQFGISIGEFCLFQILTEHSRRDRKDDV